MTSLKWRLWLLLFAGMASLPMVAQLPTNPGSAPGQRPPSNPGSAPTVEPERKKGGNAAGDPDSVMVHGVVARLMSVTDQKSITVVHNWPPSAMIAEGNVQGYFGIKDTNKEYNAVATYTRECQPVIGITRAFLRDIIQDDPDRLALVLGHELGHLILGHVDCAAPASMTPMAVAAFTRAQEYAADKKGFELALAAGFSMRKGLKAFQIMDQMLGYSSFESLATDHPSTKDRIARLDSQQAELWKAMSAFENGALFLTAEQYAAAEECFARITREFPDAGEAWHNLGYARLMRYAAKLQEEDLKRLGFGHVVAAGFYRRSAALAEKVRGVDAELWSSAVEALKQAERLNPQSALAQENLGIAYLIAPRGPQPDAALPYFVRASQLLPGDKLAPDNEHIALEVNAAIAYSQAGNAEKSRELLEAAFQAVKKVNQDSSKAYFSTIAVLYNYGMSFGREVTADEAHQIVDVLEKYLYLETRSSGWWTIAYERYAETAKALNASPKAPGTFERPAVYRPVISIALKNGSALILGSKMSDLSAQLGKPEEIPVAGNLRRLRFAESGLDIIGDDQVLAIIMRTGSAPPVTLQNAGAAQASGSQVRVGMPAGNITSILNGRVVFIPLVDLTPYAYFPNLGLALNISGDVVREVVVTQVPLADQQS